MQPLVPQLVLRAKQLEIDAIEQLGQRAELADVIGQLIHALQRERGASSIYLASQGQRFAAVRQQAIDDMRPIEAQLHALFGVHLAPEQGATARMLSLMAWVQVGLNALDDLRQRIKQQALSAHDSVAAYSRLIAGLVELIGQVADAALHPGISRLLVAFLHVVQGMEAAGQERAVGALLFASGQCIDAEQQRVIHLIDAQERSLQVFEEFAEPELRERWASQQSSNSVATLERLRRTLCAARPGAVLDTALSDAWFEVSSERITALWRVQVASVQRVRLACQAQVQAARQDLQDSEGLLRQLRDNPPPQTHAVDRFFDGAPTGLAPRQAPAAPASSLMELLQHQASRLASMEAELEAAKRTLHERKVIERAKGVLMSRMGMTEEAAFRALQKTSMDQNRRLLDVAEATLSLPDFAFGPRA